MTVHFLANIHGGPDTTEPKMTAVILTLGESQFLLLAGGSCFCGCLSRAGEQQKMTTRLIRQERRGCLEQGLLN